MKQRSFLLAGLLCIFFSCHQKRTLPSSNSINSLELKRGDLISCGPADQQFGNLVFNISKDKYIQDNFNLGVKLLHSFEYDEAEKMFTKIIDKDPGIPMAYWGVAMVNFHPLWMPPTEPELIKGEKAILFAKELPDLTEIETGYLNSIHAYFNDWKNTDHKNRTLQFKNAMEKLSVENPDDIEAKIFYALSLTASADPADKSFSNQKKAGTILSSLQAQYPDHPGIVHYIIHSYDSPEMADFALQAARKYAAVAPSSAHALHMPSHIFTRLGIWDESIKSNLSSISSAQCYAESAGMKGHWDEEIHALDYIVYAYLQRGDNGLAKAKWDYLKTIKTVSPENFKVAYSFASIPSRYLLENKLWKEAARLEEPGGLDWKEYPWQESILHFTKLLGQVNSGNIDGAQQSLTKLRQNQKKLLELKDQYKANQVAIQAKSGEAWIKLKEGKPGEALWLMKEAVNMEDNTEKHPVTPGEVLPARQLYADMLVAVEKYKDAMIAYEADLQKHPNRFNSVYGAGFSAEKFNELEKAKSYYQKLVDISAAESEREEIKHAKSFLQKS